MGKIVISVVVFTFSYLSVSTLGVGVSALLGLGLLLYLWYRERRSKYDRAAASILGLLNNSREGRMRVHPGQTLMPEEILPREKQWSLLDRLVSRKLVTLVKRDPRHVPPDITGYILSITASGRELAIELNGSRSFGLASARTFRYR